MGLPLRAAQDRTARGGISPRSLDGQGAACVVRRQRAGAYLVRSAVLSAEKRARCPLQSERRGLDKLGAPSMRSQISRSCCRCIDRYQNCTDVLPVAHGLSWLRDRVDKTQRLFAGSGATFNGSSKSRSRPPARPPRAKVGPPLAIISMALRPLRGNASQERRRAAWATSNQENPIR